MANKIVSAKFAINTFTLTYTAGTGGTLTGEPHKRSTTARDGTPVTAVPNTGYHFVDWSDGVLTAARTDLDVTANLSVTANFAPDTFTLTYSAGTGGTLTGRPHRGQLRRGRHAGDGSTQHRLPLRGLERWRTDCRTHRPGHHGKSLRHG